MFSNSEFIEAINLLPNLLLEHIQLVFFSAFLAILIGIPLGILSTRSQKLEKIILATINILQTIPSLALFGLLVPISFFGIGTKTAIFALFIFSLLPIIKNTNAIISCFFNSLFTSDSFSKESFKLSNLLITKYGTPTPGGVAVGKPKFSTIFLITFKNLLKYSPTTSLEEGLLEFYAWYKKYFSVLD